jgi:hypothetical protein
MGRYGQKSPYLHHRFESEKCALALFGTPPRGGVWTTSLFQRAVSRAFDLALELHGAYFGAGSPPSIPVLHGVPRRLGDLVPACPRCGHADSFGEIISGFHRVSPSSCVWVSPRSLSFAPFGALWATLWATLIIHSLRKSVIYVKKRKQNTRQKKLTKALFE